MLNRVFIDAAGVLLMRQVAACAGYLTVDTAFSCFILMLSCHVTRRQHDSDHPRTMSLLTTVLAVPVQEAAIMRTIAHQAANQPVDSAEMEVDQVSGDCSCSCS
jgi:hypothetical protein